MSFLHTDYRSGTCIRKWRNSFVKQGRRYFVTGDSIGWVTWTTKVITILQQFSNAVFTFFSKDSEAEPMKENMR